MDPEFQTVRTAIRVIGCEQAVSRVRSSASALFVWSSRLRNGYACVLGMDETNQQ